ncbi:hypothetical protein HMPREF1557_01264 [Streptococcus sobrinus W1703]|uniref:Uncharacterized protein n=1 Tax=Streptococcus sobrinus W1703 TaxID=1227275 RepID=U2KFJ0_9STRE|nr:hypothetical protein HMPREF1557_01264 [Streptococcus sobrinus W1703]
MIEEGQQSHWFKFYWDKNMGTRNQTLVSFLASLSASDSCSC